LIQGKHPGKKGIWVSEFRIESGLNCGGHAFATDGVLMGPILEEFKEKRAAVSAELHALCSAALAEGGHHPLPASPEIRITVQGGIGTTAEDEFLREHYGMDATGWGSPFLLVPEATNVEDKTLAATFRCQKGRLLHELGLAVGDPLPQFQAAALPKPNARPASPKTGPEARATKNSSARTPSSRRSPSARLPASTRT
jgi:hypothetical protein